MSRGRLVQFKLGDCEVVFVVVVVVVVVFVVSAIVVETVCPCFDKLDVT